MTLRIRHVVPSILLLLPPALAQDAATLTAKPDRSSMVTSVLQSNSLSPTTINFSPASTPTANDSAPGGGNDSGDSSSTHSKGLVNYYFVFLALILCVVACFVFLVFRRKSRIYQRRRLAREAAIRRDLGDAPSSGGWANWNPERRRHNRDGRWQSAEVSREEGLNEQGEAPPPYLPKTSSEERERDVNGVNEHYGPAVPLQTLSRDQAGLKPPDYSERQDEGQDPNGRNSSASASSSRPIGTHTSP